MKKIPERSDEYKSFNIVHSDTYLKNDKKYKCKNTNQMAIIFSASRLVAYLGAILAPGSKLLSNYCKGAIHSGQNSQLNERKILEKNLTTPLKSLRKRLMEKRCYLRGCNDSSG